MVYTRLKVIALIDFKRADSLMKQRYIKRIILNNFRNYKSFEAVFEPKTIILIGENGSGKTNLLEAISLLSPGRGLRRAKFEDMLSTHISEETMEPSPQWSVYIELCEHQNQDLIYSDHSLTPDLDFQSLNAQQTEASVEKLGSKLRKIGIGYSKQAINKRMIRIDGKTESNFALKHFAPILWLTPEHDRLFVGGASDRRRFFDRMVLAWFPDHAFYVSSYEKAMRQRLAALENHSDSSWITGIEQQMAEFSAKIVMNRLHVLSKLQIQMLKKAESIFPESELTLKGDLESYLLTQIVKQDKNLFKLKTDLNAIGRHKGDRGSSNYNSDSSNNFNASSLKTKQENKLEHDYLTILSEFYLMCLMQQRRKDLSAKRTLIGSHKTDFIVTHRKKKILAKYCSTGEQKALLTGIFIAQAKALASQWDLAPILLLDEAVAHLDPERRKALVLELEEIKGQVWLTGTDQYLFEAFLKTASLYEVKNHQLILK